MLKIAILAGTQRPGALNPQITAWVEQQLAARTDIEAEVVHFDSFGLPLLDEAIPGGAHMYENEHTKAWGAKLDEFDGFIFVVPEYNHSFPGSLKNALDFVGTEFGDKVTAIVNYGADKGVRAAEQLRLVLSNYRTATVRGQASFSIFTDVKDGVFAPEEVSANTFGPMIEDLVSWGEAFRQIRAAKAAAVAA
ncbi:NADPH-dependent FMN reductase [Brevibacterium litoralis]|uniref:NADPH-dependent FMN reductase n=1 Tax=Brevibacterium litoralis TaxID=3138935 RepID=UPI0032ECF8DF